MILEQIIIYGVTFLFCGVIIWLYLRKQGQITKTTQSKIEIAKESGTFEPVSLHPYIDLSTCIGSAACVAACPEKDILGIVNGKASVIHATNCVGHGACFHACPVEAISLRIGTEKRGVELPHVNENFETNMKGIYIAGELGGMGLIKNSVEQGMQAVEYIMKSKRMGDDKILDLLIIGAGPAGISASLTAQQNKLNFETVDQDTLGGTVYSFPRSKIVMTSPMELPTYGKVKLFDTSKDELLDIWEEALGTNDIEITENTKVDSIVPMEDGSFKVICANEKEYLAANVLLAIGRRGTPRKLDIPGESLPKVSYRLLEPEQIHDKKIVVVGGGDSAIESALLLKDQNEVILSYRKDQFSRIKPKNRERIHEALEAGELEFIPNSNLVSIDKSTVSVKIGEESEAKVIENDLIYVFIGGELPTSFLKNAGVEITKRFGYIVKKHK